jgi:hypothetical protein
MSKRRIGQGFGVRLHYLGGRERLEAELVMNMYEPVIAAAAVSRSQVRRSYLRAVAGGVHNTHCSPAEERRYGALKLLALATLRLPDLVLYVHLMHVHHDDGQEDESDRGAADVVTRAVGDIAAGELRLADRALERPGCDLEYQTSAWVDRALEHAAGELADGLADGEEREIRVHESEVDYVIEGDHGPAPEIPNPPPTDVDRAVAQLIAAEVVDGSCLQIGIGAMPNVRDGRSQPRLPLPRRRPDQPAAHRDAERLRSRDQQHHAD